MTLTEKQRRTNPLPTAQQAYVLQCARDGKPINAPASLVDSCVDAGWLTDTLTITHAGRRALAVAA